MCSLFEFVDWHFLSGVIGINPIERCLPGFLSQNIFERKKVLEFFRRQVDPDWSAFTEQLFDTNMPADGMAWVKEKWYCVICMTKLITTRFPKWYIEGLGKGVCKHYKHREPGDHMNYILVIPPGRKDCPNGWNCRSQYRRAHAAAFNVSSTCSIYLRATCAE